MPSRSTRAMDPASPLTSAASPNLPSISQRSALATSSDPLRGMRRRGALLTKIIKVIEEIALQTNRWKRSALLCER